MAVDPRQFDKTKKKCDQCVNGRISNPDAGTCGGPYMDCPKCHGEGFVDIPVKDRSPDAPKGEPNGFG